MIEHFKIAIIGSGPSGLSAAAQAAEAGVTHVLLEADAHPASVTRSYQKGKHVMAEPRALPLRSRMSFGAGRRENILEKWESELESFNINFRANAKVIGIKKVAGVFHIKLESGVSVSADYVILAIGLQSNIRMLNIPGADHPRVQYQLDDPDEFNGEHIAIIGGGDASLENALALMPNNNVTFITRLDGFFNCKPDNESQLRDAAQRGDITLLLDTQVDTIEWTEGSAHPLNIIARAPQGREEVACDRIIARLGAEPPRKLLESFGITFAGPEAASPPQLSPTYESSVPGLYIVGALGGYPLIKQAMNQGYDVVQRILGIDIKPVDEMLLEEKFKVCPHITSVEHGLDKIRLNSEVLSKLSPLQLRDFMLESKLLTLKPGDIAFRRNDYSNSLYFIIEGELKAYVAEGDIADFNLQSGQFFGEMGLISGRRRTATIEAVKDCILVEASKHTMQRLIHTMEPVRSLIDDAYLRRAVQIYLRLPLSKATLNGLMAEAQIHYYEAGEELFHEGDVPDGLYMIRRGSVTLSRVIGGKEVVLSYVSAGNYVGEMALVSGQPRVATVRATVKTEAILLTTKSIQEVIAQYPAIQQEMNFRYLKHVEHEIHDAATQASTDAGNLISFLVQQGIGDATDVLLIDESRCIGCDNCEKACAETHEGTSRLDRKTGPIFDQVRVPSSCRHCENPLCMTECPPDAIRREVNGEIVILDNCIGCGNCVTNCPYDVIQLASIDPNRKLASPLKWLFGLGTEPGACSSGAVDAVKLAVKCDMCNGISGGPACVRSCPTGAAIRMGPEEFLDYAVWRNNKVSD